MISRPCSISTTAAVRYITLSHSEPNLICDSSYSTDRPSGGLSPFGREVIAEMNRLGIMVDISHVTDDAFYQAIEISKAPMIASHSCCRHFTPGFERNMTDEMIIVLADKGWCHPDRLRTRLPLRGRPEAVD